MTLLEYVQDILCNPHDYKIQQYKDDYISILLLRDKFDEGETLLNAGLHIVEIHTSESKTEIIVKDMRQAHTLV